ncbi:MAG: hypothetical protein PHD56_02210 [Anaerostipes sp.]|nr:hypothetical protein [Anaerostipes sp.]
MKVGRPRKKPDFDAKQLQQELFDAVIFSYNNPAPDEISDKDVAHKQLKLLGEEFSMTPLKIRKILITGNAYMTDIAKQVQELYAAGKSIQQIQEILGLSRASVHSYLPYKKGVYKTREISTDAERIRVWRNRQAAVKKLTQDMTMESLWETLILFAGYPFHTVKGLKFNYSVRGNEIFINRKEKSITKSSVDVAFHKVMDANRHVLGPKKLGVFGASYLYPIFVRINVIVNN